MDSGNWSPPMDTSEPEPKFDMPPWVEQAVPHLHPAVKSKVQREVAAYLARLLSGDSVSAAEHEALREELNDCLHLIIDGLIPEALERLDVEIGDRLHIDTGNSQTTSVDDLHRAHLELWIEAATRGLCREARERIRPEIEAHYADAREQHRATCQAPVEAHRTAMSGLGDPDVARQDFLRTYLTEGEAECFRPSWPGRTRAIVRIGSLVRITFMSRPGRTSMGISFGVAMLVLPIGLIARAYWNGADVLVPVLCLSVFWLATLFYGAFLHRYFKLHWFVRKRAVVALMSDMIYMYPGFLLYWWLTDSLFHARHDWSGPIMFLLVITLVRYVPIFRRFIKERSKRA
jgi:hypothetical protein